MEIEVGEWDLIWSLLGSKTMAIPQKIKAADMHWISITASSHKPIQLSAFLDLEVHCVRITPELQNIN